MLHIPILPQKKAHNKTKKFENSKGKIINNLVKKIADVVKDDSLEKQTKNAEKRTLADGLSLIHVYFKELEVVKYSKEENYGLMELIGKIKQFLGR